ncbi:MAG: SUF system NifU family Fe-S cluster assembly protein [Chloroflexi bacterium]|nr:SUF system NifU family Fe-S cluster assembly protein [Chloroflexota bacterium]
MSLADELYREIILDHYRNPRNRGVVPNPTIAVEGANPLCGDEIELTIVLDGERVTAIRFKGVGCSISQASASMMMEAVEGKSLAEAEALIGAFKGMMHGKGALDDGALGDIEALLGVRKFPIRIKCALLAWTTLEQGIKEHRHE